MEIFDAHTYFFGRQLYEYRTAPAQNGTPKIQLKQTENGDINALACRDRLLANMDASGVERAVVFASIPEEAQTVTQAACNSKNRLVSGIVVNPLSPQELAGFKTAGGICAMMLCPVLHEFDVGGEVAGTALDAAAKQGMISFVRFGQVRRKVRQLLGLVPHDMVPDTSPRTIIPVAQNRLNQVVVISYFGPEHFEECLEVGRRCANVYADTAGWKSWCTGSPMTPADAFKDLRTAFGSDRILYGSDSGGFPGGYRGDILDAQIAAMKDAGFSGEECTAVLGGNLARLLQT